MSKFLTLYEAAMNRFARGGFLVGDRVTFTDKFKTTEEYKQLGQNVKDMIDQMIESGLNVRVTDIKNEYPSTAYANPENSTGQVFLDIALDTGGGRYTHLCTIPQTFVQPQNDGVNLPPVPDNWKRPNSTVITPREVGDDFKDELNRQTDKGTGSLTPAEIHLPDSNVSIPAQPATPSPGVNPGSSKYLQYLP